VGGDQLVDVVFIEAVAQAVNQDQDRLWSSWSV
jgi:hypothetical protein